MRRFYSRFPIGVESSKQSKRLKLAKIRLRIPGSENLQLGLRKESSES